MFDAGATVTGASAPVQPYHRRAAGAPAPAMQAAFDEAREIMRQRAVPRFLRDLVFDVAVRWGVSPALIMGRRRRPRVVRARGRVIWRIMTERPRLSSGQIGRWLGLDHTTVLYAAARHAERHGLPSPTTYDLAARLRRKTKG